MTHGKLKRYITAQSLSNSLQVKTMLARSILIRMEQEKLVERGSQSSFLGYKVIFAGKLEISLHDSEGKALTFFMLPDSNRALIRKAVQYCKYTLHAVISLICIRV